MARCFSRQDTLCAQQGHQQHTIGQQKLKGHILPDGPQWIIIIAFWKVQTDGQGASRWCGWVRVGEMERGAKGWRWDRQGLGYPGPFRAALPVARHTRFTAAY